MCREKKKKKGECPNEKKKIKKNKVKMW